MEWGDRGMNFIDEKGGLHSAIAECKRTKGVNGEKSLSGIIYTNAQLLQGIGRGWRIVFEDENYCLTYINPIDEGTRVVVEFDAVHEFFFDMQKSVVHTVLNGSNTAERYLQHIFNGSSYTYRLEAKILAFEKENFGLKNRLTLFKDFIQSTGVEFSVNGRVVRILEKVGTNLSTIVKKGFNLNELHIEKDTGSFITYMKGYGAFKDSENPSKGRLEVEYLSPLAKIYGKLEGDPVVDERYTQANSLVERLKEEVESSYGISVDIDMEDLTKAGYDYDQPHEGDYIMAINQDLGFEQKVRILSYTTSYDVEGHIVEHDISCGRLNLIDQSQAKDISWKNQIELSIDRANGTANFALISADGKSMTYYGPDEPIGQKFHKGDIWYQTIGEKNVLKIWNGSEWWPVLDESEIKTIKKEFEQQQSELEKTKQSIAETNSKAQQALIDAGFAKNGLSAVEKQATEALKQAEEAYDHFLETDASITELKRTTLQVEKVTNQLTGELSQKVSQTTFDQLKGTVKNQETLLNQTAEGLEAKASITSVDAINKLVSQHTTNLTAQGDKLRSLVTETDGVKVKLSQLEQTSAGFQRTVLDQLKGVTSQQTQLADQYTRVIETIGGLNGKATNINAGWEIGSIARADGKPFDFPAIRSTEFIEVEAEKPYMVVDGQGDLVISTMVFYDENKQLVAYRTEQTVSRATSRSRYLKVVVLKSDQPLHAIDYAVIQSARPQKASISIRSQLTQTADRFNVTVQKGDIIAQLNIEAGHTLIQNKQLVLDADTVTFTGKAFIPMALIKDLRVDAAKVYGTLDASKVRVINLDAANISSGYINNQRLRSRSITADKLATNAIQVGFNNYSQNLQLNPTALSFHSGTRLSGKLTSEGMEFWYGTRKIGRMGENSKSGKDNVRGIVMDLEDTGDFVGWNYMKHANDQAYTSMLLLDPKGKFTGKSGIHMDADVYLSRIKPNYTDAKEFLEFSTVKYNNYSYSGLLNASGKSGIFMGGNWLYLLHNNLVIPVEDIRKVIYTLKGLGRVSIPTNIARNGTVNRWKDITF